MTNDQLQPVSRCVDRSAILLYAEITDDFNPIHVDPEFARRSPMGGIIAHGMLSLNFVWQSLRATLGEDYVRAASLRIRFVRPVREGDVVTAGGQRRGDDGYDVWVRNQQGEDVIVGTVSCGA